MGDCERESRRWESRELGCYNCSERPYEETNKRVVRPEEWQPVKGYGASQRLTDPYWLTLWDGCSFTAAFPACLQTDV
jgi:hypothetical protein